MHCLRMADTGKREEQVVFGDDKRIWEVTHHWTTHGSTDAGALAISIFPPPATPARHSSATCQHALTREIVVVLRLVHETKVIVGTERSTHPRRAAQPAQPLWGPCRPQEEVRAH